MANRPSIEKYIAKFPKSKALFEKSKDLFPRGVPHEAWFTAPFPVYVTHAKGSREWDLDGYEYIDYFGGHGGLILGHAHPSLIEAVNKQIEKGTQYGATPALAIEWAELVKKLIPSAERVEFTSSGTEANMLGIRLARAFTGRTKMVRFRGQMGGWYDSLMVGEAEPWDVPTTSGLLPAIAENTTAIPVNDEEALEKVLSKGDVAILICEAAGAYSGVVGIKPGFLQTMRDMTRKYGTLLLFDEVITAFRYSPGGVQAAKRVIPDMTSLGKPINGCFPGAGAIVGRADIMDLMVLKDAEWNRFKRIPHPGTFNANPLCSATGIATLKILATGEPQKKASEMAGRLRKGLHQIIEKRGIVACSYGESSFFHLFFGDCKLRDKCDRIICLNDGNIRPKVTGNALHINLMLNGVHMPPRGLDGFVSAVHTKEDIDKSLEIFDTSFGTMIEEGIFKE